MCPFCGGTLPRCAATHGGGLALGRVGRATLVAAGAALIGTASCENRSIIAEYGAPGFMLHPDAGAGAAAGDSGRDGSRDASSGGDGESSHDAPDVDGAGTG